MFSGDIVEIKLFRSKKSSRQNRRQSDLKKNHDLCKIRPQCNIMMQKPNNEVLWESNGSNFLTGTEENKQTKKTQELFANEEIFKSSFSVWRSPIISISINLN